jgi:hypothetical protein
MGVEREGTLLMAAKCATARSIPFASSSTSGAASKSAVMPKARWIDKFSMS